jgi:diguanylate cyclase (GGDEF)-like protein
LKLADNSIITEIKTSGQLPSPTGVALRILELTRDPNTSTEDMAAVLVGDPALTGQILKYANSAKGGARNKVTNINDALVRLGMSLTRQLCLGFSVLSNSRRGPCVKFDYNAYWTRSLAMAVSSNSLCSRIKAVSPDEGFTCGLLGKIGHLALASVYPERYAHILDQWNNGTPAALANLENRELSLNHNQVTSELFEDWGLPESYRLAVAVQEETQWKDLPTGKSPGAQGEQLGRVLNIANLCADICMETGKKQHSLVLEFMKLGEELGFTEEQWTGLYDEIMTEWERLGDFLNIMTRSVPGMENLVKKARQYRGEIQDRTDAKTNSSPNTLESDSTPDEAVDSQSLDILVVTDSPVDRRIIEKKLKAAGHRLSSAGDGQEALEMAIKTNPQLILTDMMLPNLDGLELTQSLRQSTQASSIYIIIMTTTEGNDDLVKAFDAGIDDYVAKPLNHRILQARLKAATRLIHLQEQAARNQEEVRSTLSELGILNRQLQTMALEDQLTQLPNRRCGLDHFEKEWSRTARNDEALLCMILDIDHFKKVNDTYGHDAGDVVLQKTAAVMKDCMRSSDIVCRFGGEEFLVICPGADVDSAKMLGNRLRKAVENNVIDCPEFQGNITISIGVAMRSDKHSSPADMIKNADEALYAAKNAGRNLVCIAAPD